jgi:hypothetical protein
MNPSRMELLGWEEVRKGALLGRARVRLPIQLEIADIGIFAKDGARWAQMPSEVMRDATGQVLTDERGKPRYRSPLKWASRDLQERFSAALIALVEAEHGPIGGGSINPKIHSRGPTT